jgi:hypothetical protein
MEQGEILMKHWYLPTLLVFVAVIALVAVDYAMDHWQTATLWITGSVAGFCMFCIGLGWFQAWMDARETDKLLGGGL